MIKHLGVAAFAAALLTLTAASPVMAQAKKTALFLHCLPAHRGEEVTDEVIDGPNSIVVQEASNRMHVQKGIMAWLLSR